MLSGRGFRRVSVTWLPRPQRRRLGTAPVEGATFYVNDRSRLGAIHCVDDFPHVRFDHWPVHGRERYQRNAAVGEVLFVFERLVARDQNIKPGTFRGVQQSAVFQTAPAHVRDCERIVMREQGPQIMRDILVQEDLH